MNTENDLFSDAEGIISGVDGSASDDSFELPSYLLTPVNKKTKTKPQKEILDEDLKNEFENKVQLPDSDLIDENDIFSSDSDSDDLDNDIIFQAPSQDSFENHIKTCSDSNTKFGFIYSLLDAIPDNFRDPEANRFRVNYKYWKEKLARKIFEIYNRDVFMNKLPVDTKIIFNPRFLTKGGTCQSILYPGDEKRNTIVINISPKVCDGAQRLLEVMVHEMCHGAVFIINKLREVHGPIWRSWCLSAHAKYGLVSLSTRCHSYAIRTKYEYRCQLCSGIVKRHSRSLKYSQCKKCRGELVLFSDGGYGKHLKVDLTKPLTTFAQFVKDNYKVVRPEVNNHKEVMSALSSKFHDLKREEMKQLMEAMKKEMNNT